MSHQSRMHVPERLLRQLWKDQNFSAANLRTTDGRPVEILSPGISNHNGGPDFTDAQIRIDGHLYRGSIEVHRSEEEWKLHRHHQDTKYNRVILHVVLHAGHSGSHSSTESSRSVPVLALDEFLSSSWGASEDHHSSGQTDDYRGTIKCFGVNAHADSSLIETWIEKLAVERFELKVRKFDERLREILRHNELQLYEPPSHYDEVPFGLHPEELPPPSTSVSAHEVCTPAPWNQILYEGVMEALGYSKNQQSFLMLARSVTLSLLQEMLNDGILSGETLDFEALLFGVAGLLPTSRGITDAESRKEIRKMRAVWKGIHPLYHQGRLSSSDWQFFRLRPENFPTVRLAGASRLLPKLLDSIIFKAIIGEMKQAGISAHEKLKHLEGLFIIPADEFWASHYRFGESAGRRVKTLVGDSRARDILINVVIPLCLLYARVFRDKGTRQEALALAAACPPFGENSITHTMHDQLVRNRFRINSVLAQQGMIQLYKMFCLEERCGECAVGKVVF